jgi:hypothetical protein
MVEQLRRRMIATAVVGGVSLVFAAAWGLFADVERTPRLSHGPVAAPTTERADAGGTVPLSMEAFAVRLSPSPPPPTPPAGAPSEETSRAGRLELLAISTVDGHLVAAIYDAVDNRVHLVRSGERIGDMAVTQVGPREVRVEEGDRLRTLSLSVPADARVRETPGGST